MKLIINKLIFLFVFIGCFFSCVLQKPNEKEVAAKEILDYFKLPLSEKKLYLIIPNSGCGGCIHNAEVFLNDNLQNPLLHAIFTSFDTMKGLKIHLGKTFYHPNITIDKELKIPPMNLIDVYPIAVFVEDGKVKNVESFSAQSNLFKKCTKFINSKSN